MDEFVVRLNPKSSTEGNASSSVEVDITSDAATSSCGHNYETQTPVEHENDPESGEEFEGEGNPGPANPWPYMSAFFMFEKAVMKNRLFLCQLCPPTSKPKHLSCSAGSNANLRRHLTRVHPGSVSEFDALIRDHRQLSLKKYSKKREQNTTSQSDGPKSKKTKQGVTVDVTKKTLRQPRIDFYSGQKKKFTQKTYEEKVSRFSNKM